MSWPDLFSGLGPVFRFPTESPAMPTVPAWKRAELKIAAAHGCRRTPLSGGNGRITRADVIHPEIFIDNKHTAKTHSVCTELREIRKRAEAEKKIGVLTLTEKGKHGWHYVIHSDDLARLIRVVAKDLDFTQAAVCDGTIVEGTTLYIGSPVGDGTLKTIAEAIQVEKKAVRTVITLKRRKAKRAETKKAVGSKSGSSRKPQPISSCSTPSE